MKKLIFLIAISAAGMVLLSVSSCEGCGKAGNGKVITEEKKVMPFDKITIEGVFPVELSQDGNNEWVKVETDENLQDFIIVSNEGDRLVVKNRDGKNLNRSTKMKVYINIKNIHELKFSAVGNLITVGTLKLDSLDLTSSSVGKLDLQLNADYLHAQLEAVGNTILGGKVREARINNKSVGALSAFDLKADTLMIHNTAVGSAEVYANSAFYIRSSAIGSLTYAGPGTVKELESDGIGKVRKRD